MMLINCRFDLGPKKHPISFEAINAAIDLGIEHNLLGRKQYLIFPHRANWASTTINRNHSAKSLVVVIPGASYVGSERCPFPYDPVIAPLLSSLPPDAQPEHYSLNGIVSDLGDVEHELATTGINDDDHEVAQVEPNGVTFSPPTTQRDVGVPNTEIEVIGARLTAMVSGSLNYNK